MTGNTVRVLRDVDAVLIPLGTPVTIPEGTDISITQELGGSFTVVVNANLARIDAANADALGRDVAPSEASEAPQQAAGPVDEDELWAMLKTCYDPEIPVNIVDLGLVYDCHVVDTDEGGNHVDIVMTLTAPGCGMGPFIVDDVRRKVLAVANVTSVDVDLTFEPPWDRAMMSDEAKLQLGLF